VDGQALLSSTAGNDDHESVHVDSAKDDDDTPSNAIAIRHRGGFSLLLSTTSIMPIFFIIQLYAFLLQVGFGSSAGFRDESNA
jgi:hypothetical protein